jgi:hypothetical protein
MFCLILVRVFFSSVYVLDRYDEQIGKRARPPPEIPVGQQYPEKRKWKIINDAWVPEKIDYPLQGLNQ